MGIILQKVLPHSQQSFHFLNKTVCAMITASIAEQQQQQNPQNQKVEMT